MDYGKRLNNFQQRLAGKANLAFFPLSADLQYLAGVPRDIPNFGAVIHPGDWLEGAWLSPDKEPILALSRMSAEFGGLAELKGVDIRVLNDFADPRDMVKGFIKEFALPEGANVALGRETSGEMVAEFNALAPGVSFISASDILQPLRAIKSEDEIAMMRKAGEVTEKAFAEVVKKLELGMLELDIVAEVDYQLRKHGSLGPSFTTSLYNSGPNHPLLFGDRLNTWKRALTPPVSILFDFGAILDGYCYDYGRTVFFGEPNDEAKEVYRLIMASQAAGIAALQSGKHTTSQADAAARAVIVEGGYGPEFRHRLGHAIGLDVHERPFLTAGDETPLEEGMLFTIEPSITQLHSFSARVEDVVVARPEGGEKLTNGFQELIIID